MSKVFKKMLFPVTAVFVLMVFNAYLVEAKSLKKGDVYRSLNGEVIEVISSSELEVTEGKKTTLAKYGFKDDKLRAVFGDTVIYYEINKNGLKDEKTGEVYYSKSALAVLEEQSKKAANVVQEYFRLIEKGDISKAYELFSQKLKSEIADGAQGLSKMTNQIKEKGGIKDIKIISVENVTDEIVVVFFEITFGDGSVVKNGQRLVIENGMWKQG